jgi:hypothetical protein
VTAHQNTGTTTGANTSIRQDLDAQAWPTHETASWAHTEGRAAKPAKPGILKMSTQFRLMVETLADHPLMR